MDEQQRYQQGLEIRRKVLGDEHVNLALKNQTEFNAPFQDFITRYAWGEVWSRPGLSRHARSLITLAMLVALNRKEEFIMHVRAALRNGVTAEELRELILHSALYCGLPAANNSLHWAEDVLKQTQ